MLNELEIEPNTEFEVVKSAAESGNIGAMKRLAEMYEKGIGTEVEIEKARYWENLARI